VAVYNQPSTDVLGPMSTVCLCGELYGVCRTQLSRTMLAQLDTDGHGPHWIEDYRRCWNVYTATTQVSCF